MKDPNSFHLKVQEHIDCFATADPLKEMSVVTNETDKDMAALKWIALATLHGINNRAKKIVMHRSDNGDIRITAKYRTADLPSTGSEIGARVFKTIRNITHIESKKGKSQLALGIRDSNLTVTIKMKTDDKGEKLTIKFPG